jgi:hypothetical protein
MSNCSDFEPNYIKVDVGEDAIENQLGNFYNAIDGVVCYFQAQTGEIDANLAKCLRLFADRMEDN